MNTISLRARSIGEILDGAFRLYRQDLGLYVVTAILAALPMAVSMVLTLGGSDPFAAGLLGVAVLPIAFVAYVVVWAALMIQMNERLEGREPVLGPSVGRALRLTHRVVWAGFITYVVLFGVMFVTIMCGAVTLALTGVIAGDFLGGMVGGAVGVGLVLTLGVRVFAGTMLFMPGVVVEDLTGYGSVKRGFALTKKSQFRVTAVILLAWILVFVPIVAVYFVTGTTSMIWDPEAATSGTIGMGQLAVQQLLAMVSSGFTTPFLVACVLLAYYDQRVRVEAFDVEAEAGALAH